jgi:hypothetical protein
MNPHETAAHRDRQGSSGRGIGLYRAARFGIVGCDGNSWSAPDQIGRSSARVATHPKARDTMKALLGLILLAGAAAAVLYGTGALTFDPAQQASDVKAKVKPGMDYKQVIAVAQPKKYCVYVKKVDNIGGMQIETWKPGPDVPFDEAALTERIDAGSLGGGFQFRYVFSGSDILIVKFDEFGAVEDVYEDRTIKNLFDQP